jgi:hypothetical protein
MIRATRFGILIFGFATISLAMPQEPAKPWRFAVSGDSRNCGDVAMPAIAKSVLQQDVQFYWHLGDFRLFGNKKLYKDKIDEDMCQEYNGAECAIL